jgi:general secretion pathway protein A
MYNSYFGFKEAPFSIAPDPRYLYMTRQHREALAHLVYGLNSEGGCILLTGEVGTGKTTVCRCLLEQIPEDANIALVFNPKVTAMELLETICDELKTDYPIINNTPKTYIDSINRFLIEANARNEKTVLIIDEAQNLDSTVLEQLRLLTNLETNQRKLLQIIILGQPELLDILSQKEMRQLSQRITARFHLNALSSTEVKGYISHRLAVAGQNAQLFPDQTIKQLYSLSRGIPRLINILCDRALLGTYVQSRTSVDTATLSTAAKEVFGELPTSNSKFNLGSWQQLSAVAAVFLLVAILVVLMFQKEEAAVITEQEVAVIDKEIAIEAPITEPEPLLAQEPVAPATEESVLETNLMPALEQTAPVIDESATTESIATETNVKEMETAAILEEGSTKTPEATIDAIKEFIVGLENENKKEAYSALFKIWKRKYPANTINACSLAQKEGLSCLHNRGDLKSLQKLNRPAILKLYNNDGKVGYAILTQLDQNVATLDTGWNSFFEVKATSLEAHWYGEYTLLWQKPPFYRAAVEPGSSGPVVQWLDQQLTRLYGQGDAPTIHNTYSDELIMNVKRFQQSKGLIPDGVAGPLTFIHLNSEIGAQTPLLSTKDS